MSSFAFPKDENGNIIPVNVPLDDPCHPPTCDESMPEKDLGRPPTDIDRIIHESCCRQQSTKRDALTCKITEKTLINVKLSIYNTILKDPYKNLTAGEDYCPSEESPKCPPPAMIEDGGELELVINGKITNEEREEKTDTLPNVGCKGEELTSGNKRDKKENIPKGPTSGFPIIVPIKISGSKVIIVGTDKKTGLPPRKDIEIGNQCPTGPMSLSNINIPTRKTCRLKAGRRASNCSPVLIGNNPINGEPIYKTVCIECGSDTPVGAECCGQFSASGNSGFDCSEKPPCIEECLDAEPVQTIDEEGNPETGWVADLDIYLRKKGADWGNNCIGVSDQPQIVVTRKTETKEDDGWQITENYVEYHIIIGDPAKCEAEVPEQNQFEGIVLCKRIIDDCEDLDKSCTEVLSFSNFGEYQNAECSDGYEEYYRDTCISDNNFWIPSEKTSPNAFAKKQAYTKAKEEADQQCKKEEEEYNITGYCCTDTPIPDNPLRTQPIFSTTTFKTCCDNDGNWLGSEKDVEKLAALAECQPKVLCCIPTEEKTAILLYSYRLYSTNAWTYTIHSITGNSPEERLQKKNAFLGSGGGIGQVIYIDNWDTNQPALIVSNIPSRQVCYSTVKLITNVTVDRNFACFTESSGIFKDSGKKWEDFLKDKEKELRDKIDKSKVKLIKKSSFETEAKDAHYLFDPNTGGFTEGSLKYSTIEGGGFDCVVVAAILKTSVVGRQEYYTAAQHCTRLLGGKVALEQNASNYQTFYTDNPCETISVDCSAVSEPNPPTEEEQTQDENLIPPTPVPQVPPTETDPPTGDPPPTNENKPPEKQPRKCQDVAFGLPGGGTNNRTIGYPLSINDPNPRASGPIIVNSFEELQQIINGQYPDDNSPIDTDNADYRQSIIDLIGLDSNLIDADASEWAEAIGGLSWSFGDERACEQPAPGAPPNAPNPPDSSDPSDPPESTECADRRHKINNNKQKISRLQSMIDQYTAVLNENVAKKRDAIEKYNQNCGDLEGVSLPGNCTRLRNNIANFWDGDGDPPFVGANPNPTLKNYRLQLENNIKEKQRLETEIQTAQNFIDENC